MTYSHGIFLKKKKSKKEKEQDRETNEIVKGGVCEFILIIKIVLEAFRMRGKV